jgi:hypothetical protein
MATLSYSSFPEPRVADELVSSSSSSSSTSATSSRSSSLAIALPRTEQLSIMDAAIPIDLKVTDVSPKTAVEDEDSEDDDDGLSLLDVGYHIAPTTPTKARTRRATMPVSMKPVPFPPPDSIIPDDPDLFLFFTLMVYLAHWPPLPSKDSWIQD